MYTCEVSTCILVEYPLVYCGILTYMLVEYPLFSIESYTFREDSGGEYSGKEDAGCENSGVEDSGREHSGGEDLVLSTLTVKSFAVAN
ncbi:hypothetical protein CDAR_260441 [Caerostris darwini]|uniref:Uncharacterized protein n=1 Tax=Caerostris darwini TaxID=1538125 RepID=A0AAV4NPD5_9ARAC|nr:hypothetical protein CDAR_260441 [Caerostris darwini]